MVKLNVGSNDTLLEGWINIDLYPRNGAIVHDARTKFPYDDNSIDFIFSEHFIEHLTEDEGILYFKECFRMLKPGGVVRTSTFDIDNLMYMLSDDQRWDGYSKILYSGQFAHLSRTEFFNFSVYEGGVHKYMYNHIEMLRLLQKAGFNIYTFPVPTNRQSIYPELQNLEWRQNSDCIVEAIK